jgi:hypothetical protein
LNVLSQFCSKVRETEFHNSWNVDVDNLSAKREVGNKRNKVNK